MTAEVFIQQRELLPEGKIALVRDRQVVWIGSIGSPIEDAVFDLLLINPKDYERMGLAIDKFNYRASIISALKRWPPAKGAPNV